MKLNILAAALAISSSLMMTSCVKTAENSTTDIFNIDNPCDMAVTLYYDVDRRLHL